MRKNILHSIFFDKEDHWDSLVRMYGKRIGPVALAEIDKFRYCGDIKKGFRLFVCEEFQCEACPNLLQGEVLPNLCG